VALVFLALASLAFAAPQTIPLWPEGVPDRRADASPEKTTDGRISNIHDPSAVSARPDFAILVYPVISMSAPFSHTGSRDALLGKDPPREQAEALSVEKHVRKDGPPVFIAATSADTVVSVENSLAFHQALVRAGVPAELHVYPQGSHGNCYDNQYGPTAAWPLRMEEWLRHLRLPTPPASAR
jgi:acetyl esterase/lipase